MVNSMPKCMHCDGLEQADVLQVDLDAALFRESKLREKLDMFNQWMVEGRLSINGITTDEIGEFFDDYS